MISFRHDKHNPTQGVLKNLKNLQKYVSLVFLTSNILDCSEKTERIFNVEIVGTKF